ncbi:MAG: L-threonylcarbamoyladenylate synthase [bacterium]
MKALEVKKITQLLKHNKICILPTDTVYGLFCRALSKSATTNIYRIKGRASNKPLQLFLADKKDILKYALVAPALKYKILALLPGPYTVILKLNTKYAKKFSFLKNGTAGFRVIKSKLINSIIKVLKEPLAATSANISGSNAPGKFVDIDTKIIKRVSLALSDDKQVKGKASKVIDYTTGKKIVIRP